MTAPKMTRLGSGPAPVPVAATPYTVIAGSPDPRGENAYADPSGLRAGIAIYGPCTVRLEGYPADEYCFLIEGDLLVTDPDGTVTLYKPGDAFLLPRGYRGDWHMPNGIRKYYVVFDPAVRPAAAGA